jgi:diketogulonate reductase-like aldo/keto reductase
MQRGVVVIPKASSEKHLAANLQDMFSWRLNNQQKVRSSFASSNKRRFCYLACMFVWPLVNTVQQTSSP